MFPGSLLLLAWEEKAHGIPTGQKMPAVMYQLANPSFTSSKRLFVCMEPYTREIMNSTRLKAIDSIGLKQFWVCGSGITGNHVHFSSANLSQSRSSPVFTYILCISQPSSTSVTNTHTQLSKKTAVKPRLNLSLSPI